MSEFADHQDEEDENSLERSVSRSADDNYPSTIRSDMSTPKSEGFDYRHESDYAIDRDDGGHHHSDDDLHHHDRDRGEDEERDYREAPLEDSQRRRDVDDGGSRESFTERFKRYIRRIMPGGRRTQRQRKPEPEPKRGFELSSASNYDEQTDYDDEDIYNPQVVTTNSGSGGGRRHHPEDDEAVHEQYSSASRSRDSSRSRGEDSRSTSTSERSSSEAEDEEEDGVEGEQGEALPAVKPTSRSNADTDDESYLEDSPLSPRSRSTSRRSSQSSVASDQLKPGRARSSSGRSRGSLSRSSGSRRSSRPASRSSSRSSTSLRGGSRQGRRSSQSSRSASTSGSRPMGHHLRRSRNRRR